ncbi:hypothetical protein ACHAXT_006300 [Thalassiosira profunda]
MSSDFGQLDNDGSGGDDNDNASFGSEDSQEPYYHVATGKIFPAREAWGVLAAEGHPRFATKSSGASARSSSPVDENDESFVGNVDSVFRDNAPPPLSPETPGEDSESEGIQQVSSFGGPTQSSIDRALHPESPNYMRDKVSPKTKKDLRGSFNFKKTPSYTEGGVMECPESDDSDVETDPVILRAKAMALAAQNGQKLTAEQMQLIAQPDVQQQKLIEEAKRIQKAKERGDSRHGPEGLLGQLAPPNLQQIGADFKKFVKEEREKPPGQWGADLGKFIETQSMRKSNVNESAAAAAAAAVAMGVEDAGIVSEEGGEGRAGSFSSPPSPSPKSRKKMEGFGNPNASPVPTPEEPIDGTPLGSSVKGLLGSMNMPQLPMLNESLTNMMGSSVSKIEAGDLDAPIRISGVLWKRRSGFGKHSTTKAWEKRRVELRGCKVMYYKSAEEEEAEGRANAVRITSNPDSGSGLTTPRSGSIEVDEKKDGTPNKADTESARKMSIFDKATQAAEQLGQNARDEFTRLASVTGLQATSDDAPRGVLDLLKEKAAVSASMGHSGAPTPFCLSIKVKSETKWKFCFDSHKGMMDWLAALTDAIVKASVDAAKSEGEGSWERERYCVRSVRRGMESEHGESSSALSTDRGVAASVLQRSVSSLARSGDKRNQWMIAGISLYVAWGMANLALILARCSTTSIDQYWQLVVFTNFAMWMLCTRPEVLRSGDGGAEGAKPKQPATAARKAYKPIAGNSTVKVAKVEDPNVNENGDQLPSWVPVSSNVLDVRSHGYLTTKKKIPSPGELYECVAVDCFVSDTRFPDIVPRMRLPPDMKMEGDSASKTWKSPDVFVVSIAIPTEAPRFGQSSDDGPGLTIVGYFRMKDATRKILQRITAAGYDPSADTSDADVDVQKRIVNGVRLWERYCNEAPSDPTFQARFKLIPSGNLEDLGLPSYIAKYNGKPVLIKRNQVTGFFTDYPSLNAMEFDISLHPFPYLFKQAMAYLNDYFDKTVGTFGFVIEGRDDEELPEVVIGAMKVCYPSPKFIVKGEEFFGGTCQKSCRD